jgi:hypothetical protein
MTKTSAQRENPQGHELETYFRWELVRNDQPSIKKSLMRRFRSLVTET